MSTKSDLHKIIIGVDFGTTYTGVSYVDTSGSSWKTIGDVHCIRTWPGPGKVGESPWKVPSRIAYGDDGNVKAWGYDVTPKMQAFTWMKLLLDSEEVTKYDDPSLGSAGSDGILATPRDKDAVQLCADFLQQVAEFCYDALKHRLSEQILSISPLEFWFTVPAIWSDKAKERTLRALQQAASRTKFASSKSFETFLVPEPEAAAVAALSSMDDSGGQSQIKQGDRVLVCDCGGGTVDITTYEIKETRPLRFEEYLIGTGGKCGSTYIDRNFKNWMAERFGAAYTGLPPEKKGQASRFMRDFEACKRDFGISPDDDKEYEMMLSMDGVIESRHYREDERTVVLNNSDLRKLFDPVVEKILDLVESQFEADFEKSGRNTIKTIILAGGFGDSMYLYHQLKEWCETKEDVSLLCPENPQAAIVRGAALCGLRDVRPMSRIARRSYGIGLREWFDPAIHSKKHLVYNFVGEAMATGYVAWTLHKGDRITEETKLTHDVTLPLGVNDTSTDAKNPRWSLAIFTSDLDKAPRREDDPGCRKLTTIIVESDRFATPYTTKTVEKGIMYRYEYTVDVFFGARQGLLWYHVFAGGQEIVKAPVQFDGDYLSPSGATGDKDASSDGKCCVQ